MPFPLAHPAAVLPLRRYCSNRFNFPALVVGSISPDLAYSFGPLGLEGFSHSMAGTFGFCLPAGLLVLLAYRYGRSWQRPALNLQPAHFAPLQFWPAPALLTVVLSLLLGALTHQLWDGLTHETGWFVQHISTLRLPVCTVMGHQVRVFHILWYGSSFAGVVWLYLLYERWRQGQGGSTQTVASRLSRAGAVAVAALFVAAMHHLSADRLVSFLAGFLGVLLVLGLAVILGKAAIKPQ